MKMQVIAITYFVMILFTVAVYGQNLSKKPSADWGTTEPCTQAVEEIAAEVNERLREE